MTILMLASEYPPARGYGLARFAAELADGLVANGHTVHVVTCNIAPDQATHGENPVVHHLTSGVATQHYHWVGDVVQQNLLLLERADAVVRAHGPFDCIISHDWLTAHTAHALRAIHTLPWLLYMHDTERGKREGELDPQQQYIHDMEEWALAHADQIITVSQFMQRELHETFGIPETRISVIPPGLKPERFRTDMHEPDFRALFARPDVRLLLFVGRLSPVKGVDILLEAFALLPGRSPTTEANAEHPQHREQAQAHGGNARRGPAGNLNTTDAAAASGSSRGGPAARPSNDPPSKLIIVGDGVLRRDLEARAAQPDLAGRVLFTGPLGACALGALYRSADLLIVPSRYEPFGMVALEAAALGTPVLAHATGGLRELATKLPGIVSLVDASKADSLARGIVAAPSPSGAVVQWPTWKETASRSLAATQVLPHR